MKPRCDFCSLADPCWDYVSAPFMMLVSGEKDDKPASMTFNSDEGWLACDECKTVIDSGDREALADRSLKLCLEYSKLPAEHLPAYRSMVLAFQATFWDTKGEPKHL